MKTTKYVSSQKNTIKVVAITSLVWIVLAGVAIGFIKYGEYQHASGMLKGFESARDILHTR